MIFRKNFSLLIPILLLIVISLLNMYGASYTSGLYDSALLRQSLWVLIGFFSMYMIYRMNMNFLLKYSDIFYWLGCLLLALVLFFGARVNGAASWFKIGPVSFQPSEIFKFFYLLHLAKIVKEHKKSGLILFLKILTLTFIPCILIFLEPDTGVVLMYILMMFGIIFASNIDKKYPLFLISVGLIAIVLFFGLYFLNGDLFTRIFGLSFFYRMDRLLSFKNVSSYQLRQALIGVGASGLFGFGLTHKKMYIPEATTDFVFDLTILNFGLLVGIVVVTIYASIIWMLSKNLKNSRRELDKCIISGTLFMTIFQVFEHILMNLGLTPITGITLPFLSYGGSSLLSYFLIFGLILKITTNSSSYN